MASHAFSLGNVKARIKDQQKNLSWLDKEAATRSAVFLPLLQANDGSWSLLFEVRSRHLAKQPGEICFPGGHVDNTDPNEEAAAIRETCEELRLPRVTLEVWSQLDILITPYQLVIYPFIGLIKNPELINPDPAEVAAIFTAPLERLLSLTPARYEMAIKGQPPKNFPFAKIPGGRDYPWRTGSWPVYFYEFDGRVIWGFTARILHHFLEIIR